MAASDADPGISPVRALPGVSLGSPLQGEADSSLADVGGNDSGCLLDESRSGLDESEAEEVGDGVSAIPDSPAAVHRSDLSSSSGR